MVRKQEAKSGFYQSLTRRICKRVRKRVEEITGINISFIMLINLFILQRQTTQKRKFKDLENSEEFK